MEKRLKFLGFVLLLAAIAIISKLFFWQVIKSSDLSVRARSQYLKGEELVSRRGSILASDGHVLAISQTAWNIWAQPDKFSKTSGEIADKLAQILIEEVTQSGQSPVDSEPISLAQMRNLEKQRIYKLLTKEGARWVLLREKVSQEQKQTIEKLNLTGINFIQSQSRMYPEASMAASLVGFVGKNERGDDQGYFGLEGFYDLTLAGKEGFLREEQDAKGNPIPFGLFAQIFPVNGLNLHTFIDRTVQFTIETELARGIEKYGAKGGSVTVITPDGKVLGMASLPSYDPANYKNFDTALFRNQIVFDSFEPGSIFKILVMAAGLDSGAVKPDTRCDICTGPVVIDKYSIGTWDDRYYPDSTMTDVIVHSDNIGMIFVAKKLGIPNLVSYLEKFGIGHSSGIDLQEEANPGIRDKENWGQVDLATASFGQGIAVTPIQFIRAVGVIANDGVLPYLRVVEKLNGDGTSQKLKSNSPRRIISEEATREIRDMMVRAVEAGEAKWTKMRGFKIAGKTGTAQIPIEGHYDTEKTIASFVGFAPAYVETSAGKPADKPKFVMLVTLREPTSSPWGSETAAPLWFSIAKELFPYFGIQPSE